MYFGRKRIISSLLVALGVWSSNSCSLVGGVKRYRSNGLLRPRRDLVMIDASKGKKNKSLRRSKSSSDLSLYLLGALPASVVAGGFILGCFGGSEDDSGKGGKPATPGKKSGTKNCGPYEPKESNWKLYYQKEIGGSGTILRIYHGNIIQIGRDEDIFRDQKVSNEDTVVVSTDNPRLSPGDTIAAEMASAANDQKLSGSYKYKDDDYCRKEIKRLGKNWGITGILGEAGGYLKVGNIFHIVAPHVGDKDRDEIFKKVYVNCILSSKKGGGRVVIPPLGDGNYGNSTEDTAKFFAEALKEVSKKKDCKMPKYVDLVILSNPSYDYDRCQCENCNKKVYKYEIFVNAVSKVFGKSDEIK